MILRQSQKNLHGAYPATQPHRQHTKKLSLFVEYYNVHRSHWALKSKTPFQKCSLKKKKVIPIKNYKWQSHVKGLFYLPEAA